MRKQLFLLIGFLLFLNLAAHFIPFERAAMAPDDFTLYQSIRSDNSPGMLAFMMKYPDRPLNYLLFRIQFMLIQDKPAGILLFTFLISSLFTVLVFFLFRELLQGDAAAFWTTAVFILLIHKLEVYHTPVYANLSLIMALYVLSFLLYVLYRRHGRRACLLTSMTVYALAAFGYEIGFFLPCLLAAFEMLRERGKRAYLPLAGFFLIMVCYGLYRTTGGFGLFDTSSESRPMGFNRFFLTDFFHHYAGRYFIRTVLYGMHQFVSLPRPVMALMLTLDCVLAALAAYMLRRVSLDFRIPRRAALLGLCIMAVFTLPLLFYRAGGVGSRHLLVASAGFAVLLVWLLQFLGRFRYAAFAGLMAGGLIVCQGNAWSQAVACRINAAVYSYIKAHSAQVSGARLVVIDTKSFADAIPFTLIKRQDSNILNTYFGAQAFEDWGLKSMVCLAGGSEDKTLISKGRIERLPGGDYSFIVSSGTGYRQMPQSRQTASGTGVFLIDFNEVYPHGFRR